MTVLGTALATAVLLIAPGGAAAATIHGTQEPDRLYGTGRSDVVYARAGGDVAFGRGGADALFGQRGGDALFGGPDADRVVGGAGRDRLYGGAGNDRIEARGGGGDAVACGSGHDVVAADSADAVSSDCEAFRLPPPRPVRPGEAGIAAGGRIQKLPAAELNRELEGYRDLGARWVRFDLNWSQIEAAKGSYEWTAFDRIVAGARAKGLRMLAILTYTPAWARPPGVECRGGHCGPARAADYARFVTLAARRYARLGVRHWEIWNEPNLDAFWRTPDPGAYTRLLAAAYRALKAVDPGATVLLGGTAPAPDDGLNIPPVSFVSAVYGNGGGRYFDALSHHPYTFPAPPGDAHALWGGWQALAWTSPSLRSLLVANGDAAKRIWGTEYGTPLCGAVTVTEEEQAAAVSAAYALFRSYPWAGPLFWHSYRDHVLTDGTLQCFGLVRLDFSPRLAYAAYRVAARSAGG